MATWQTIIEQLPTESSRQLAEWVRDYFVAQGTPLTLNQLLEASSAAITAVAPETGSWIEALRALLAERRQEVDNYADYVSLFAPPEQAIATIFSTALQQAGISYDEFRNEEVFRIAINLEWCTRRGK